MRRLAFGGLDLKRGKDLPAHDHGDWPETCDVAIRGLRRALTSNGGLPGAHPELRVEAPRMMTVRAVVQFAIPEFELVHLLSEDGELTMCVGKRTKGVNWRTLREGQVLECDLDMRENATRVVRARIVSDN